MATFHAKLTDRYVSGIKPPKSGQDEHFDTLLPSFAVRVGKSGARSFVVLYRYRGEGRRYTLGRHGVMTLADAREEARAILQQVSEGKDPRAIRAAGGDTDSVDRVVDRFIEKHAKEVTS